MLKKKALHWIYDVSENRITCGYCGASPVACDTFKYCPRCGKRMEGYRFINMEESE